MFRSVVMFCYVVIARKNSF